MIMRRGFAVSILFGPILSGSIALAEPEAAASPKPSTPTPRKNSSWLEEHKKSCDRYYTGKIQAGIRRSCQTGGVLVDQYLDQPPRVAETGCRMQYGEEPGETYACLIGTKIARELEAGTKQFMTSLQLCSESYPVRTELDTYLLESCLVGIHAPSFVAPSIAASERCLSISPERSFVGPCAVGASLSGTSVPATSHRVLCEKYFDHLRFHLGYRTCVNARAVSIEAPSVFTLDDIRRRCDTIVSDPSNDHERGACVIGVALFETQKKGGATTLFDACGVNQARYEDRDVLGCLAAGSFLSFAASGANADRLCKEIFRDKKSLARSGCLNSVPTLAASAAAKKE